MYVLIVLASVFGFTLLGTLSAFIVPDEIPSLLSIVYSNIPTIKKGTDSRIGWGFRLGDRADFQFLVELGPQTNTKPLANQPDTGGNSKRNAASNLRDVLYAQQQTRIKQEKTEGGQWIADWSQTMKGETGPKPSAPAPQTGAIEEEPLELGVGEIDAKSVIPDDSVIKLEELYYKKSTPKGTKEEVGTTSTEKPRKKVGTKRTTPTSSPSPTSEKSLDDVSVDDE